MYSTPITNITYSTTGATGATVTNLPTGVTGAWAGNVVTISGTPTVAGAALTYTVTLTGGCGVVTTTGTIAVTANNTAAAPSSTPTLCINTVLTNITIATTGATGIGAATGLPAGVTASWLAGVITISGTPTASGTFNYSIPLTGGCGAVNATGTITVTPANTLTLTSALATTAQTVCIGTPITNITYSTTGATGATVTNLPTGVTGAWAGNVVTISGTPTVAGAALTYTVTLTGGCGVVTTTGTIAVTANNTAAAPSSTPTLCINTVLTNITIATTGATGIGAATGLPAGVTASWLANVITISGTPTASGTFNYSIPLTGGCSAVNATGTITVTPANTLTLTSALATTAQTVCIGTPITNITYSTTGATGATVTNLPTGVTGAWAGNVVTISGTPTVAGAALTYTVTLTGGCGVITTTGTIAVTANNTAAAPSSTPTLCINTVLTNITIATTGATGIGAATGLPAGVTASWLAGVITISGTPTASGTFNYSIPLTGGCGAVNATGTITVTPANTLTLTSALATTAQTVCIGTPITNITYSTTGATGATVTNLPTGVTGAWAGNVVTISGTPTVAGAALTYTVTLTGGCGVVTTTGTIAVTANNTITRTSALATIAQTVCIGTPITNITYSTTGATGATVTNLPTGVTGAWAGNVVTISGTPTVAGAALTYTVTLTGGCGVITTTGTIAVTANNTITRTSALATIAQTVCIGTPITNITYSTTGATGATVTNLPTGVTGAWAGNVVTISGTPTVAGAALTYTVTLTGGCGVITTTGTIAVTANNTVTAPSSTPTLCINTVLTSITHATTGATGIGGATGLPAGVTASWLAGVITISGTPTASGTFNYSIPLTGGCGTVNATGSITVTPANTITRTSAVGTDAQTVCTNTTLVNITYLTTGATGATITNLPTGVTGTWAANVVTISGTPTVAGAALTYTVTLTGGCGVVTTTGTITVNSSLIPTYTTEAGATACAGSDVTYATQPGQFNYLWTISGVLGTDYSITSGGTVTDNSVTLKWLTPGSKTVGINYTTPGGCTAAAPTFSIPTLISSLPTISNAGPDQTGAAMCGLTTTTLAANTPVVGIGTWSIVGGTGGTIIAPNSPTSTFTGTAGTAYVLRWSITNAPCSASTDDVNITFNQIPTVANAGPDQTGASMCGLTTATLSANTPVIGIGTWTIIGGSGGNVILPNSPTSIFTGTAGMAYTLRWTIANAPCTPSSDDVNITFNQAPSIANAGPDQTGASMCGLTSTTLAANTPAIGTGLWTITAGTGGTITTPSNPVSTFTGTAGMAYTLRWTITNAPCAPSTDDVNITFNQAPTVANAGPDQTGAATCGLTTVTLAANTPAIGTGAWTITAGTGGTVTTPTSPTSTFTGTAGMAYTLRWTIANAPCTTSTDDVNITFNQAPTVANAGPDQTGAAMCGLTTTTLAANTPVIGTGAWTIIAGAGGTVTTPTSPVSTFTGTAGVTYTLRWTITNAPCTASSDNVIITFNQAPTVANAGPDQTGAAMCGLTTTTLAANTPVIGTGAWTITAGTGGTVTTPTSPVSTFTGTAGMAYTLRWTITNAPCTASTDDVNITFNQPPTVANAGPDQTGASMCGLTSTTLAANTPVIGTGAWTITAGTGGTVTTPTSPTSTFTGTAGNAYTLRWTITNAPCTASTDDVNITFNQAPTVANAGPDQTGAAMCGITTTTLAANTPVIGTGSWTITAGTGGTVTTPTSPVSTFTGTAGTAYTLRWTIANPPCTASTDDVNIKFNQAPTVANAGPDQTGAAMCGVTTATLAANTPVIGTGAWTITAGIGGTITTPTSPTSTFTGTAGMAYTLRWTISNAPCTASTDDVNITFNQAPTVANAGPDQTGASTCGLTTTTLAANTPVIGTGAWTITAGTGGTVTTPTSPISTFTGTAGMAYTLRWTITNAPCTASTDDVNITFNQPPTVANAGPDQTGASMCGLTSTTLAANTPVIGTGAWTITAGTGGTVTTPTSPTSTFTGTAGNAYTLRWTITNAPCTASTDDVNITFNQAPTVANAGPDQTGAATCGLTTVTLAANTPAIGTGSWTITAGTGGTVTTPTSPVSTFTGTAGTAYTLRWTIANPPCTASTDDVNIKFNQAPTVANAGPDQTGAAMCGVTTATLAANTPVIGTGAWTITAGIGGTITTPTSPTSTFTGTAGMAYTLRWTISNAPCTASTDDVNITFNQAPTVANAGPDQTGASTCGLTTTTLAANTPVIGTGAWTITAGTGGTVTTPTSPISTFTGTAGMAYTLRWTITNAPCTASTDDVNITFNQPPTVANAGPDQTGASMCGLTSTTLAANTPVIGTGAWTITAGTGGTVTTPTSPTSTFTGTAGNAYTLRWTITNAPCTASTDDVNITFNQAPTVANAGADQTGAAMCGLTTTTLAANTPAIGTGAWSIIAGTGGIITTPTSPTSTFTGTAGTSYTLRWTITNAPCTPSTDDVDITFNQAPTVANAGPDQTGASTCGLTTVTLAANTPVIGTGAWTITAGTGGTVTTPTSPVSTFTGTAGTAYTLRWTITNAPCTQSTDDVNITFNQTPTVANAGPDQMGASMCGLTLATLAANTPTVGTGSWSIVSGTGGVVNVPTSPTSTFTGTVGMAYTLRWTITNAPCTASTDDVNITFNQTPTIALAGPDQTGASMCGLTTTTLAANTPVIGTGAWSITSGTGGTVTTPASPTSTFTGTAGMAYTLRWTISNAPCTASTDDVNITFNQAPTIANAGPDQTGAAMCGITTTTLAANTPTVGTGAWSIIGGLGGTIIAPTSPTSTFTGVAGTAYTLRWTITNAPCAPSSDDVNISFNENPTIANAGLDQAGAGMCGLTITTLTGNTPIIGTGTWSIVSGVSGNITAATSPTSTFSGIAGQSYVLRWTIVNGPCTPSTDDVTITFNMSPTFANAGPDQTGASMCGLTSTTLAANTPAIGTGAWSIISGTGGNIATPTSPTSTFTGTAGMAYVLRWTISNPPCPVSTDDVNITFNQTPTVANAGPDQIGAAMCGLTSTTLAANTPAIGTGAWSIISGTGGTVTTPISPVSSFTGIAGMTYTLRWTIDNAPCTPSTDDVDITFNEEPTIADAGPDQTGTLMCGLTSTTLGANTPVVGTGLWTIVSGTGGNITDPTSETSNFTGVAGTAYTLRWTITNPPCVSSSDDVNITFNQEPTIANAGPDQTGASTCGLTTITLAANTPVLGTGAWTIVSGTGGTVTTPTSPVSAFTGTAGMAYTLRWTVTNAPCTPSMDDVNITFNEEPTVANAGPDQNGASMCGLTTTTLAANTPVIGTGAWTIIAGLGGTVTTPTSPVSTFTGTAGMTYTLRWTITNAPCPQSTDDVDITFNEQSTIANAGPDQIDALMCGLTTTTLAANTPVVGTGAWSIVAGTGGIIATPTSPTSTFTGTARMAYTLRWTITNAPCAPSNDDVNVTFNIVPTVTITDPAVVCGATTADITAPAVVSGSTPGLTYSYWSDATATTAYATPTIAPAGTYYIKGTNTVTGCFDIKPVIVTVNPLPIVIITNPAAVCGVATVDLTAPAVVAGSDPGLTYTFWTDAAGTTAYATPATAVAGTYYIKGTNTVSGCFDIKPVIVTVNPLPIVIITNPAAICGVATVDLTAPAVVAGSDPGLTYTFWSDAAGTTAYATPATAVAGTYYIKGTNTVSGCFDIKPVIVTVNPLPIVIITNPAAVCGVATVDLTAPAVVVGSDPGLTYTFWTDAAGTTAYATPATAVAGTYYIKGTNTVSGCFDIKPVIVTVNPLPIVIITNPAAVCGVATVDLTAPAVVAGSDPGLTYTFWSDAAGTTAYAIPATAPAGTYYIKGTNTVSGCFDIKPVTVTVNPLPIVIITNPAAICGVATVDLTAPAVVAGSDPGLTYTFWTDAAGTTAYATPATAVAGTYYIKGTNTVSGCFDIKPVIVTVNPLPIVIITNPAAICGVATVDLTAPAVVAGSDPGLTYTFWSDAAGTTAYATPATAVAGTYYIKGTNTVSGCFDIKPVIVTVNPLPIVIITNPAAICGVATVDLTAPAVVAGSDPGLTYTFWTDAAGTTAYATPATAVAGTYYIKGTNTVSGCFDIKPVTVTVNPLPIVIITNPAAVCGTTVDLTAPAVVAGSDPGLTYTFWSDAAGTTAYATPATTAAGTYYIKGTNAVTGCYDIKPVIVVVNSGPSVTTMQINVACFGGTTGSATALPSGGNGTYTYSWNTTPVQTTVTATGLPAGTYIVTVTDGNGCIATGSAIITEPATAVAGTISSLTNVSFSGGNDGSVTVLGSGGSGIYQYKIGSGAYQASGTFGGLIAGSYNVTVEDMNLCTFIIPVTISQPTFTLTGSITSQTNVACFGTLTGSVTVAGSGGNAPYDYSLNSGAYQPSGTFGALAAGTYTVTIRDAVLNTVNVSVTITQPALALSESITSQTNILCFGSNTGAVTVNGAGGVAPYQYKLGTGLYQTSGTFGSLIAGTYTITVQDANLCTFDGSVTITQPANVLAISSGPITNVSCNGSTNGAFNVTATGGTSPYTFSLNGGPAQVSGSFSNLAPATYTVSVIDANLCTTSISLTVTEPAVISIESAKVDATCPDAADGSITLTLTGGTQPYNVIWSDGITTFSRQNINTGTYSVVVTDQNGCAKSLDVVIGLTGTGTCIEIPDIITPNNDGYNDTWKIKNIDMFPNAEVFVFTRWGKLVFNSKNLSANPWNGTFKGKLLPTDSYHYILHLNDGSKVRTGVISIIR
jgi:gliding motility-associated-like protein